MEDQLPKKGIPTLKAKPKRKSVPIKIPGISQSKNIPQKISPNSNSSQNNTESNSQNFFQTQNSQDKPQEDTSQTQIPSQIQNSQERQEDLQTQISQEDPQTQKKSFSHTNKLISQSPLKSQTKKVTFEQEKQNTGKQSNISKKRKLTSEESLENQNNNSSIETTVQNDLEPTQLSLNSQNNSKLLDLPFGTLDEGNQIQEDKISSGITPTLQNVVATANLGCTFDLMNIVVKARNAEYNPKRFSAVIMRIR